MHPLTPARETKLYDLLGVSPEVSEQELKKAYRKKALSAHPDKGGDPEVFKEITSAYDVLSDSDKRDLYDRLGEEGLKDGGGMGGMDPSDLFSQLFGGRGGFFGGGGPSRPSGPRKGKDLIHRIKVSLEELYNGKTTKLALQKHVICKSCKGLGGKEGAVKECAGCKGQGVKFVMRQMGPMIQQLQQTCPDCDGTGELIDPKNKCKVCNGKKITSERKVLEVRIDKGMEDGQQITFKEEADQAPNTIPGDVVIIVDEKPHPRFKRRKNDLVTDVSVDLLTALGGGQVNIPHLDDHALAIEIPRGEVIKPGETKVLRGQGMPSYRHHEMGDLYVNVSVTFPDSIPEDKIQFLEKSLPPRAQPEHVGNSVDLEPVVMEQMDEREERNARATNGDVEMDEDDDDGSGPQVQCAQS